MKQAGKDVELVNEFAKQLVWHDRQKCLACQPYVFGKQLYKVQSLLGKVEFIVTDSPIILSVIYSDGRYHKSFDEFVIETYKSLPNINILLTRSKPYNPNGRNQTLEESEAIQTKIVDMLQKNDINYWTYKADPFSVQRMFQMITDIKVAEAEFVFVTKKDGQFCNHGLSL